MKEIPLSMSRRCQNRGRYVALVDDEDYAWALANFWSVHILKNGAATQVYAVRNEAGRRVFMHRAIAERTFGQLPHGAEIDHVGLHEYGGLDNRRSNLRIATRSGNMANVGLRVTNKSGFKGVWWDANRQRWCAKIKVAYKAIHLGRYVTAEDAARAYDTAALAHFGEFARLNIPTSEVA